MVRRPVEDNHRSLPVRVVRQRRWPLGTLEVGEGIPDIHFVEEEVGSQRVVVEDMRVAIEEVVGTLAFRLVEEGEVDRDILRIVPRELQHMHLIVSAGIGF